MAEKQNPEEEETYVLARGAYGVSSSVPVSKLKERTEQQKQIEEEIPFEEMQRRLAAIPIPASLQRTKRRKT